MRPPMTESDELVIEDWGDSNARTTEWSPKYLQALHHMHQTAHAASSQGERWLYGACGVVALVLGLLLSRALVPLIVGSDTTLPQELLEDSALSEPKLPDTAGSTPPTAKAKDATRPQKAARSLPLTAAKSSAHGATRLPLAASEMEQSIPPVDPSIPPDLDLMDAPSSAMELRALADSSTRISANSMLVMEQQRQHDPMGKLDVLQDPGVELGTLRINSRPWSQVFIDGKPAGNTPLLGVSLSAGQHTVRLVNNSFNMRKTFDVVINAGESTSHIVSLGD